MDKDILIQHLIAENKRLNEYIEMLCDMGIAMCDEQIEELTADSNFDSDIQE